MMMRLDASGNSKYGRRASVVLDWMCVFEHRYVYCLVDYHKLQEVEVDGAVVILVDKMMAVITVETRWQ